MAHSISVRRSYNARVQYGPNAIPLGFDEWTSKIEKETQLYTTFESLGSQEIATCVSKASGGVKGKWNSAQNGFDNPVSVYPRDDAGPMKEYLSQADGVNLFLPVIAIPSASIDATLAGKLVNFGFDYESNAPFNLPTGSFGIITG